MGFVVCLAAMALVGAGAELASIPRADIAFLLYAAGRVLDGARLYVDIVEVNPPLIVGLNLPAVLLARAIGAPDLPVYRVLVTMALLGSVAFADWCARRVLGQSDDRLRRRFVVALAFALFLAVGDDFGQREHLLVALVLPYLLLAAARLAGHPAPVPGAIAAGLLAGLGLALKPQFLLLWAAVEVFAAWRLRARRLSYEALAVGGVCLGYLAGVALLTPEYFRLVGLLGPAYIGFGSYPFAQVLVTAPGTALYLLAGLVAVTLRRHAGHRSLWDLLLLVLMASFLAAAAQQKGWGYHFYPARVAALLLLVLAAIDLRRPLPRMVQRLYAAVAVAALGTTALLAAGTGMDRLVGGNPARELEQAQLREMVAAVRRHAPPGGSLYAVSYSIEAGFPLVNYSGLGWASRFPHLWILEAVYQDRLRAPAPLAFRAVEEMGPAERYLNDAVYEDLARNRPDIVLVLRHARDAPENVHRRLDYLGYFSRDERIAGELGRYRYAEEVGEYRLYTRSGSREQPGTPPRSEPGRYDLARGAARPADGRLLLATLTFLLLAAGAYGVERRLAGAASSARRRQADG